MPPHPLTNFEIKKYYQKEPRFNGIYSRDNLPERNSVEIKDGAYITNLDEYSDVGTHWIALYIQNNDATYFDSFGVEHIPKDIKKKFFRIQTYDSIMCGCSSIGFIYFILAGKTLTDFTNLFSPNIFKRNDDIF